MAQTVEFPSNGGKASGYLVTPASGSGPGILVIQEWWGLDSGIKEMADRLGAAGFVALAPDLYHGQLAQHDEMDKAAHLMQSLPPDRAGRDMSAAVDYLASHSAVSSKSIGVVGFCMGGLLSFIIAANRPDKVTALVPFYGFPQGASEPDWSKLQAVVRGHMAEHDDYFKPEAARALEAKLRAMGKDAERKTRRRNLAAGDFVLEAASSLTRGRDALAQPICRREWFVARVVRTSH
jgi:carboxymethylenebutenolidase